MNKRINEERREGRERGRGEREVWKKEEEGGGRMILTVIVALLTRLDRCGQLMTILLNLLSCERLSEDYCQ